MSHLLRRLPLSRLLILCGLVVALGVCATALAAALGTGPTPPPKPLADAIHDALAGAGSEPVQGVSAQVQLTDHLLEGANLASAGGAAGQLSSSPLLSGASGRLWISNEGRARLELQSEKGDTEVYYDGHTLQLYDAATNTLYRYTIPAGPDTASGTSSSSGQAHSQATGGGASETLDSIRLYQIPTVAQIEAAISRLGEHANVSGATPTDIAGQAAYTTTISPNEAGSPLGDVEIGWDAVHGTPLRVAAYARGSGTPALELAVTAISYGPVESSVFEFTPPSGAKVSEGSSSLPAALAKLRKFVHANLKSILAGKLTPATLEAFANEGL